MTQKETYTSASIKILKGLEGIQKRPAMYIGNAGANHLVLEILANAVDEVNASGTDKKEVILTLHKDNSISIQDFGRGTPQDLKDVDGKKFTGTYIIFTELHAGAKFDEGAYQASGGTYGVGAAVVTALSQWVKIQSVRADKIYTLTLHGETIEQETTTKNTQHLHTGTTVTFLADPKYFANNGTIALEELITDLDNQALLNKEIKFIFNNEQSGNVTEYFKPKGIVEYLETLNSDNEADEHTNIFTLEYTDNERTDGSKPTNIGLNFAFEWTTDYLNNNSPGSVSYVNSTIYSQNGGSQVKAFVDNLVKFINKQTDEDFSTKNITFGLKMISNTIVPNNLLVLANQTKTELITPEVKEAVNLAFEHLTWKNIEANQVKKFLKEAKAHYEKLKAALQTDKEAGKKVKKSELLKKFKAAASNDSTKCELYICEGASAAGNMILERDKNYQAVLPLRGKVLNVVRCSALDMYRNAEIKMLIDILQTGIGQAYNEEKLRYHKIIIATDADADGYEIANLLIGFFLKYMPKLIQNKHLFLSNPPLYYVKNGAESQYCMDLTALNAYKASHKNLPANAVQRFKGLGEMDSKQLEEMIMNASTRRLTLLTMDNIEQVQNALKMVLSDSKDAVIERSTFIDNVLINN